MATLNLKKGHFTGNWVKTRQRKQKDHMNGTLRSLNFYFENNEKIPKYFNKENAKYI